MARAARICPKARCPRVADGRYCPEHNREYEAKRGTAHQRGYTSQHQRLRASFTPLVEAGRIDCWRCGQPIEPGQAWDLGHDDEDRTKYQGPEHANQCNRSAAGRRAHLTE